MSNLSRDACLLSLCLALLAGPRVCGGDHKAKPQDEADRACEPVIISDSSRPYHHDGTHAFVRSYDAAMDHIGQELLAMLKKERNLLVVWLFDESESMKDDQKEIQKRLKHVYARIAHEYEDNPDVIKTAVAGYGENIHFMAAEPTANVKEISRQIDRVPIDRSGKERTCTAVAEVIARMRKPAETERRNLVLFVATDERGDAEENEKHLELVVSAAKKAGCRIYFLGREASFGHPYAYWRWAHPLTKRTYFIQIDRGPESPTPELLTSDAFGRPRRDVLPSGFGPYAQVRLVRETGGVVFTLPEPSENTEMRTRYPVHVMRKYAPDWRARKDYLENIKKRPLRLAVSNVVGSFNPWQGDLRRLSLRVTFSTDEKERLAQAKVQLEKAEKLLARIDAALTVLESATKLKNEDSSARWRANYALTLAELLAFKVRVIQYHARMEAIRAKAIVLRVEEAKVPPGCKACWRMQTDAETIAPKLVSNKTFAELQSRAKEALEDVAKEHKSTPWALRAKLCLKAGFGVTVVQDSIFPPPPRPIPKL